MPGNVELDVTDGSLEQLRCSLCEGYLSCSPIHILPNGSNVCSQCSPPDKDVQMYRQLSLEAILSNATFPCKFSQVGCLNRLPFGSTIDHEAKCSYRPSEAETSQLSVKKPPDLMSLDVDVKPPEHHEPEIAVNYPTNASINNRPKFLNAPASGPGSTRSYNSDRNTTRGASTSSNRSYNVNWNGARAASARMNHYGYDVHWNNRYDPRNNWHHQRPRYNQRDLFFHKRNHRNSVIIIKGGTFYINL